MRQNHILYVLQKARQPLDGNKEIQYTRHGYFPRKEWKLRYRKGIACCDYHVLCRWDSVPLGVLQSFCTITVLLFWCWGLLHHYCSWFCIIWESHSHKHIRRLYVPIVLEAKEHTEIFLKQYIVKSEVSDDQWGQVLILCWDYHAEVEKERLGVNLQLQPEGA